MNTLTAIPAPISHPQTRRPMITLTQNVKLKGYQVQATLRKRDQNHPFIAVLMLADENAGLVTASQVAQSLLPELPKKASQNLLERLTQQGYFEESEDLYQLTDLGWQSARQQEVWTPMEGLYDLYLLESPFVPQRIVELTLIPEREDRKNPKTKDDKDHTRLRVPDELSNFGGNFFTSQAETYEWENAEAYCFPLDTTPATLTLTADPKKGVSLRIQGEGIGYEQDLPDYTYAQIRQALLIGEFRDLYVSSHDWVSVGFNSQQLDFSRKAEIRNPRIEEVAFNAIYLDHVSHQPDDQDTAQQWFETLLTRRMDQYFFSEADFQAFQISTPMFLNCSAARRCWKSYWGNLIAFTPV